MLPERREFQEVLFAGAKIRASSQECECSYAKLHQTNVSLNVEIYLGLTYCEKRIFKNGKYEYEKCGCIFFTVVNIIRV